MSPKYSVGDIVTTIGVFEGGREAIQNIVGTVSEIRRSDANYYYMVLVERELFPLVDVWEHHLKAYTPLDKLL